MQTLAQLRKRHAREEQRLILSVFIAEGWNRSATAQALDVSDTKLARLVAKNEAVKKAYDKHKRSPGRPKKQPKSLWQEQIRLY